jgi:PII-like signaling protein
MNTLEVTFVRIYLTEGEGRLEGLLQWLHNEHKVRGFTVFRAISGFGKSGKLHYSNMMDISLDLPVVIEFFDEPIRAVNILEHLAGQVEPGHIVSWPATLFV